MNGHRRRRNTGTLWTLVFIAVAYSGLALYVRPLTGIYTLDGAIGVVLGLYIASRPAANAIDVLFFERDAFREISSEWSGIGWLALNIAVLVIGWIVIVIGATRLVGPAT